MKKVLYRKLLTDYLNFLFITLISSAIVIWVFQAVNFLDIIIEDGRDFLVYIKFSLLNFPKILGKIFPFVLFFSIFYVTTKYELKNELVIFWNFGVHKIQIVNFIFKVSIIFLLIQIFLTSIIIPFSQDIARSFIKSSNVNFLGNFIKPKKFNDTIKGLTIYTDYKDKNNNLYKLYLKKEISNDEFQITYAKKGEFKEIKNLPILVLYEGVTITSKKNKVTNISFSKSDFSLKNLETNTTTYKKTQELNSLQLMKCIYGYYKLNEKEFKQNTENIENCSTKNIRNIFKELYKRFIVPLYIPLLSLIPLLLITSSKESSNYFKIRVITFSIGLFVVIFSETTIRFISDAIIKNTILMLIPIIIFFLFYLFLFKKFKTNFKNIN